MGKKNRKNNRSDGLQQTKEGTNNTSQIKQKSQRTPKLSPQKRNEVNQLIEKLLEVTSSIQSSTTNLAKEWEVHSAIDKILSKIISIESEINTPFPERDEGTKNRFMSWLEKNGAEINNVSIADFEGYGLGLRADNQIKTGDMMIAIPRNVMMTVESVQTSLLSTLAKMDTMLKLMPNIALALLVLVERFRGDAGSFWAPYIDMLPAKYTTVLYFTPKELDELRGSPALEPALKMCRNIARQYAYFNKMFQKSQDPASELLREVFTYELYRWAVSTVMTRQNFVPCSDASEGMVNALIPFWDMCNHANAKLSTDYNVTLARSECSAWCDVTAGQQVFILYGARCNGDLLVHNGFVLADNDSDSVQLRLGVARGDPLHNGKVQLLTKLRLPHAAEFALRSGATPVDEQLLAFLRVFSMGKEQLTHWLNKEQCTDLLYADCALDTEVETKMWNFLQTRINLLLLAYPTKYEEDKKILEEDKCLTECQRLAIMLRLSEKQVLNSALDFVKLFLNPQTVKTIVAPGE
ncbi:actin-histidine N-methyltransferase [Nilaparvata lugens]|uniref:actin-histidine N-methyltransferase n=1 Tax=Nilaparvata lugens TaxID=108931 RepID=UPI00193CD97A|nr:actin-histidine N-methyltransferase [Nilaparvata lugens]